MQAAAAAKETLGKTDEEELISFRKSLPHFFECVEKCGKEKNCACERHGINVFKAGKKLLKFYRMTKTRNQFMDTHSLKREGRHLKQKIREVASEVSTKRVLDDSLNINMVSWNTHDNGWCGKREDQSPDTSDAKPYAEVIFHLKGDDGLLDMYKDICHPTGTPTEADVLAYRKSAFETALRQLIKEVTGTASNRLYVDVKHITGKKLPILARFGFPRLCGGSRYRGSSGSSSSSSGGDEAEGVKLKETEMTFNMNPLEETENKVTRLRQRHSEGKSKEETKGDENA